MEKSTKWEELETLSRDELIIRLVRAETVHAQFVGTIRSLAEDGPRWAIPETGERPTDAWLQKIVAYAKQHEPDFSYMDLVEYGVDSATAEKLWKSTED